MHLYMRLSVEYAFICIYPGPDDHTKDESWRSQSESLEAAASSVLACDVECGLGSIDDVRVRLANKMLASCVAEIHN